MEMGLNFIAKVELISEGDFQKPDCIETEQVQQILQKKGDVHFNEFADAIGNMRMIFCTS